MRMVRRRHLEDEGLECARMQGLPLLVRYLRILVGWQQRYCRAEQRKGWDRLTQRLTGAQQGQGERIRDYY